MIKRESMVRRLSGRWRVAGEGFLQEAKNDARNFIEEENRTRQNWVTLFAATGFLSRELSMRLEKAMPYLKAFETGLETWLRTPEAKQLLNAAAFWQQSLAKGFAISDASQRLTISLPPLSFTEREVSAAQ